MGLAIHELASRIQDTTIRDRIRSAATETIAKG